MLRLSSQTPYIGPRALDPTTSPVPEALQVNTLSAEEKLTRTYHVNISLWKHEAQIHKARKTILMRSVKVARHPRTSWARRRRQVLEKGTCRVWS